MALDQVNVNDSEGRESTILINLEDYVNAHVPERFRYWLLHPRGYADRFDWTGPDRERAKREKEQSIVDEWAAAVYRDCGVCPFVRIESCEPPLPDCRLIDRADRNIGVEITELVDRATIERNRRVSYHWKEYSEDELITAIDQRLETKNRKLVSARGDIQRANFQKIIVILHCDEPDLQSRVPFCRQALSSHRFSKFSEIDEAWLLLPCPRKRNLNDLEAEFCQPIRISIDRRLAVRSSIADRVVLPSATDVHVDVNSLI